MTDIDPYTTSLKREASEDGMEEHEGPAKRPRSGGRNVDVRFLVQSKNAGAIIGKGGSNINRLRTEFSASVTVPDCPGPERILAIAADVDTVGDILLDVIPKLDEYSHNDTMDFDCELRMLLHQSHAGCLIGKGGSRIKEMREKTGAQIKIFSNCCPNSTERVVQINGTPSVAVDCVKEICHAISTAAVKGPNKQYDPHHFNPMFCNDYGGYEDTGSRGRGRGGGGFRGGRGGRNVPAWRDVNVDNFSFDNSNRGGRGGFGGGRGRGMGQGPNLGNRWGGSGGSGGSSSGSMGAWTTEAASYGMNGSNAGGFMNRDKPMGGPGMGGPRPPMMNAAMGGGFQRGLPSGMGVPPGPNAGYMGGAPARPPMKPGYVQPLPNTGELFTAKPVPNTSGNYSVTMKIPNDVAGAIIGKGGQRIRKIRRDSSATINIEEASQGTSERIITISGSLQQAQMGQFLMQQSVRDNQGGPGPRF